MTVSEEENMDAHIKDLRYYTCTLRPAHNGLKSMKEINHALYIIQKSYEPFTFVEQSFEKCGTDAVHFHGLIKMPYLKSKVQFNRLVKGFHTHLKVIRRDKEDQIAYIWHRYINKERSDSDNYYEENGNVFPLQD